ncbi:allatostatin-A receptor-like [Diadema setosum]|uniref:allatostatin-A receptor-like n=1 Tax=Diadema setosum TaxID=31175 RepID=UPI003B3BC934
MACLILTLFYVLSTSTSAKSSDGEVGVANGTDQRDQLWTSSEFVDVTTVEFEIDAGPSEWAWYPFQWSWWIGLQAASAILGVTGNGLVVVIIYERFSVIRSTDVLIGALAISDLITSIFVFPIPWARRVPGTILGHAYCKLLYPSFILWLCITASTYILMAICIERYLAVVHPLLFTRIVSKRRVSLVVVLIWIITFAQVSYTLFTYRYDYNINYCGSAIKTEAGKIAQAYYAFIIRLVIPVATMLITQLLIARSLRQQSKQFRQMTRESKGETFHMLARNRIIKMMLIVVLVYIVAWTPNQIAYLCFNLGYISSSYRGSPLHRILTVLGFYNSCANPIIYTWKHPLFRAAVKDLFTCVKSDGVALFEAKEPAQTRSTAAD